MKKLKFGILITARTKSKRLKNKVILPLQKKKRVIELLIDRLIKKFGNNKICLITSRYKSDKILYNISQKNKISIYRGYPTDVLKRIYYASLKMGWDYSINITADNPFVDTDYAFKMLKFHIKKKSDFTEISKLPLGLRSYILSTKNLKKIVETKKTINTEIWGNLFRNNPKSHCFDYKNVKKKYQNKAIRLTLDEELDYKLLKMIAEKLIKKQINTENIFNYLKKNKKIAKINSSVIQKKSKI